MQKLYFPIAVDLKDKNVLIIGGGRIAYRKIKTLLKFNAKIKVVSSDLNIKLKQLVILKKIKWIKRKFNSADIKNVDIVIAATSDTGVNQRVSKLAKQYGALINVVDNSGLSDFISLALFKKAKAVICVYSNAQDPALSKDLKNFLKENWHAFLSYRNRL